MTEVTKSKDHLKTLEEIKKKVKSAQMTAHIAVDQKMIILYQLRSTILERQEQYGWGFR